MRSTAPHREAPLGPPWSAERLVFGARARALEARAARAGSAAGAAALAPALYCAPDALSAEEHEAARAAGTTLGPLHAPETPEAPGAPGAIRALGLLRVPAGALAALGFEACEGLAALRAAWENAVRPRSRVRVMGVLNVTPDSFSDGGRYLAPAAAVEHGLALAAAGADLIDVGGESTRPGARPVPEEEELARVVPVVAALAARVAVPLSIDTRKARVAAEALAAGATLVNDTSAGRDDPGLLLVAAERGAELCLMHRLGGPEDAPRTPRYRDVVREVTAFLRERTAAALASGVALERITLDPGIGFGKRLEDNLALLRALPELRSLGRPLLVGVSRKSFLSAITGAPWAADKLGETAAAVAVASLFGADIVRVHDVATMTAAARVAELLASPWNSREPHLRRDD